jgi:Fusaric acid resistance protein-like
VLLTRSVHDALAAWGGRAAAADPARQRVRLATRAAASLGLAIAVMEPVTSAAGQPVTVVMMAGIVAMVSSTSVKDGRRRDALVTIAECAVIALAVVAVAASLSPHPVAADIAFVAVMTGSVLLRRYGQRGFALGQLSFMTFFFALFLETRVHQLPWMSLAVVCGAAATAVVRCLVLPDRPASDLRRLLRAVEGRVGDLADEVRSWLTATGPDPGDLRTRHLVRAGSRLGEVSLLLERQLEQPVAATVVADVDGLRGLVFDVELAAEHLTDAVRNDGPELTERARARFAARAGRLAVAARAGRAVRPAKADALAVTARGVAARPDDAPHLAGAFARVERGLRELGAVVVTGRLLDGFAAAPTRTSAEPVVVAPTSPVPAAPKEGLALTTRTAVQVAVAGALAMLAGKEISSARWFWAVLASYVVFINASSRTATLRRAFGRVAGTVLGVAGGLLLGKAIAGDVHLEVALIVVLVFVAFWLVAISYTALVLCFTLTIATLYSILGTLSWSLLRLRIEETLAGAVIGAVVAVVVLPRRGSQAVDDDIDAVLGATGDLLDLLTTMDGERPDQAAVRAAVRAVDQTFQDLRLTIQPTIVGLPGPLPMSRRRQLLHVASIRYWARTLAVGAVEGVPLQQVAPVRSHVEQVRQLVRDGGTADLVLVDESSPGDVVGSALRHLDEALAALVDERGGLAGHDQADDLETVSTG